MKLPERYAINEETGCWEWNGKLLAGYGVFRWNSKQQKAHRASYEQYKGAIPDGYFVCHSCDNPKCVNPDHLWVGTQSDNIKDAVRKGRVKVPSRKGKKNSPERRAQISESNSGRKRSEEFKKIVSIDSKKRWDSGEMKGFTGRKHSAKSRSQKSESMKRYWEEVRAGIRHRD